MSRHQRNGAANLDDDSPAFILVSRILVALITLLLAIIPWSERYSNLDTFPHSQDTELNLLAFLLILGLVLLIVRSGKKRLQTFIRVLLVWVRFAMSLMRESLRGWVLTDAHPPPIPASSLDRYNFPLQI